MSDVCILDKRNDPSVKCRYYVEVDGEKEASAIELHEALWIAEQHLS